MRTGTVLALAASALLLAAFEADAASKCTALKYKAAGKAAFAKANCQAKASKKGVDVDPTCLAAADAKLALKWAAAEGKGDCIGTGDLAGAEQAVSSFASQLADALEPPTPTFLCCQAGDGCWHGLDDESECVELFGTVGAPGTVCDGATGTCQPPPAASGPCCDIAIYGVCLGGPDIDLAGCVAAGGLDFPFFSTCQPDGTCSIPPIP